MGSGGFEPPKSKTADLQSAPFGHSGNCPNSNNKTMIAECRFEKLMIFESKSEIKPSNLRASGGIRTPDQLITNQLLWPTELHWQLPLIQYYNELSIKHTS